MTFDLSFGTAIDAMKTGAKVARAGWHGKGMHVAVSQPVGAITRPFIYIETPDGNRHPWNASQADVLADDWGTVP